MMINGELYYVLIKEAAGQAASYLKDLFLV